MDKLTHSARFARNASVWLLAALVALATPALALAGPGAPTSPTTFRWGSYNVSGLPTYGVYDVDNVTPLVKRDLGQLIWVGPNGSIDPPGACGRAGGDDRVLDSNGVEMANLGATQLGKGYLWLKTYTFDTTDPQASGTVYVRAWNGPAAAFATAYGDSPTGVLTAGGSRNWLRWNTSVAYSALTTTWVGPIDGAWSVPANWSSGLVPDAGVTAEIPAGSRVHLTEDATVCGVRVAQGGELDLGLRTLWVEGAVINDGTLRQTREVNGATVGFLQLTDTAGTGVKYVGADVTSVVDLGPVTVAIRGIDYASGERCTSDPASPAYVERCVTVTATNAGAATLQLWTWAEERNGITPANLAVYRNVGSGVWEELGPRVTGGVDYNASWAQGLTPGFSSFLLGATGNGPTAIAMGDAGIRRLPLEPGVGIIAAVLLLLVVAMAAVVVRHRRLMAPAECAGSAPAHAALTVLRAERGETEGLGPGAERQPYAAPALTQSERLETRAGSPFEPGSDPSDPLWPDG